MPRNQQDFGTYIGGMLFVALVIFEGYSFFTRPTAAVEAATYATESPAQVIMAATEAPATEAPTEAPTKTPDATYEGKIDALPDAAKSVLEFMPFDGNLETIADDIERACGYSDFVGGDDFPGKLIVGQPVEHGRTPVTWVPGKCEGAGKVLFGEHPTFSFLLSHDGMHLTDANSAAKSLTSTN